MSDARPASIGARTAFFVGDTLVWAVVVGLWRTTQQIMPLFGLLLGAGLASVARPIFHGLVDPDVGMSIFVVVLGLLIAGIPFILLGIVASAIGLVEGFTELRPTPFLAGSSLGLLIAGVLLPRLMGHERLASVLPNALIAGLVIFVTQGAAVLLVSRVTAPNKRIERTPRALS